MKPILKFVASTLLIAAAGTLYAEECPSPVMTGCPLSDGVSEGQTKTFIRFGCHASVQANWESFHGTTRNQSCTATAPAGTVLIAATLADVSQDNGSVGISKFSSGQNYDYEKEVKENFDDAIDASVKQGDKDTEGKLKTARDNYEHYIEKIKSNMDGVRVDVQASTQGSQFDQKGGHADGSVYMELACVGPTNSREQIAKRFGVIYPEMRQGPSHAILFSNTMTDKAFIEVAAGDPNTPCDDKSRKVGGYSVYPGSTAKVFLVPGQNACFSWDTKSTPSVQKAMCTADIGDDNDLKNRQDCVAIIQLPKKLPIASSNS